ncbi:hypothetical protein Q9R46_02940 [Paenibacillus sp. RRE4]|nr:hypothetical protein [Paenibacillus sp. RRE4]MDT0121582.1 hypothetical protein [Paenibacillus sp. RRE4]
MLRFTMIYYNVPVYTTSHRLMVVPAAGREMVSRWHVSGWIGEY